jgi:hypothetical protein
MRQTPTDCMKRYETAGHDLPWVLSLICIRIRLRVDRDHRREARLGLGSRNVGDRAEGDSWRVVHEHLSKGKFSA